MRIAIFSDIHANLGGLNAVLDDITMRGGADILVAAGDLLTDGPRPIETFDRLLEVGCLMVRGNHDEYLLGYAHELIHSENTLQQTLWAQQQLGTERLALLQKQPLQLIFSPSPKIEGHDLLVCHANLKSPHGYTGHNEQTEEVLEELYGNPPAGVEVVAFGHWHAQSTRYWRNLQLVNVASVAYPKDRAKLAGYTLFTWHEWAERWHIEHHRVPFDWRTEAALLRECGIPDPYWQLEIFYNETPYVMAS